MPATDLKIKDGFAVFKDSNTNMFAVTPQYSLIDALRLCTTEDEASKSTDDILSSFYDITETFLQHLSEGIEHINDFDMVRMSGLIDTIAKMKYSSDDMPVYRSASYDNSTIIAKAFNPGETVLIINKETGKECTGTIVDTTYRSTDTDTYDNAETHESKETYDISCEFVTDEDCVFVFIKLN